MEAIEIKLSAGSMMALNIIIAVMMLGVSLDLKPNDFYRIIKNPKAPTVGLIAQFVMLPALTCLAIWVLPIEPTLGLGMMLVAACPGGSFSNIMTWLAKGNVAVSVSMTAVSRVS